MSVPLLSELREPPVVGRFYMVPTVRYYLHGTVADWPVLGPRHHDAEDLNFPHLHFHLDGRFISKRLLAAMGRRGRDHETNLNGVVLAEVHEYWLPKHGRLQNNIELRKRRCRRPDQPYTDAARKGILERTGNKIEKRFGKIAEPIRLPDGRILCPHRKTDLSSFPVNPDGTVTCPLHGLRVKCAAIADTHPKDGDVKQAPLVSGGGAGTAIAQPSPPYIGIQSNDLFRTRL